MKRLPKHLQRMSPETLKTLQTGFHRFQFGFAEVGETIEQQGITYTFLGDFGIRRDAKALADEQGATLHPYLYGKRATGWTVYKKSA